MSVALELVAIHTQLAIGLVFLLSSFGKMVSANHFARGLAGYEIKNRSLAWLITVVVIAVEALLSISHLSGLGLTFSIPLAIMLWFTFLAINLILFRQGKNVKCMCFGVSTDENVSGKTIARLGLCMSAELVLGFLLYQFESFPHVGSLTLVECIYALISSGMLLIVAVWLTELPSLLALVRGCAPCNSWITNRS